MTVVKPPEESAAGLPREWQVQTIGGVIKHPPSYGINAAAVPLRVGLPTYLRITDITDEGRLDREKPVGVDHPNADSYYLEPGDMVFARTGASTGKSYYYDGSDGPLVFAGFLLKVSPDTDRADPAFLSYAVRTQQFANWLKEVSQRSGQPGINGAQLASYRFASPPVSEQHIIAQTLREIDGLIASLDALIAKKRDIKQAAMQQLLTGRTRLPGFKKEWVPTPLANVSAFITKGATPTTYGFAWQSDGVLFLRSECAAEHGLDLSQSMFISQEAHTFLKRGEIKSGDIIITITGNVGRAIFLNEDFGYANMNQHIARVRINSAKAHNLFVYHFLSQPSVRQHYNSIVTGQAFPQISLRQVRDTVIPLPEMAEQVAIAEILSDLDADLKETTARAAKTRQIREGMMQQLLTGRIRLV